MRKVFIVVAGLLLVVSLVIAQEEPGEDFEDENDEIEEIDDEDEDDDDFETFGRNVRLDFKIIPLEGNDRGMFVITAVPEYRTSVAFSGEGHEAEVEIEGEIDLRDDGRIFVFYDAELTWEGNDGRAHFQASSGVLLHPGKALEVSRFGEKTLVIKASYIDEPPRELDG